MIDSKHAIVLIFVTSLFSTLVSLKEETMLIIKITYVVVLSGYV